MFEPVNECPCKFPTIEEVLSGPYTLSCHTCQVFKFQLSPFGTSCLQGHGPSLALSGWQWHAGRLLLVEFFLLHQTGGFGVIVPLSLRALFLSS